MTKEEIAAVLAKNTDPARVDAFMFALMAGDTPPFVIDFHQTKLALYNMTKSLQYLGGDDEMCPSHIEHKAGVIEAIKEVHAKLAALEAEIVETFYNLAQCKCPICTDAKQQMAGQRGEN